MQEYKRSTDPIIRRAAIDALGKIVAGADIKPALPLLKQYSISITLKYTNFLQYEEILI